MKTVAIIPARLKSRRFPNKLLHELNGKLIIDHVIENAIKLDFVDDIVIASDDKDFAEKLCDKYTLSGYHITDHVLCGSHRSFQYYLINSSYDYYITIAADEPSINPYEVNKVFNKDSKVYDNEIVTFFTRFYCEEDLVSPLSCKIVTCDKNYMIYNSRAVVPINKDGSHLQLEQYKKHVGIFVFSNQIFSDYGDIWVDTTDIESLEQNRFMQHSLKTRMIEMKHNGFGIDVPEQIELLEKRLDEANRNNR